MGRTGNKTRRLYPSLEGKERFHLAVRTAAKGKAAEVDHLIATAPTVVCVARDPEMMAALRDLRDLSCQFDRSTAIGIAWLALLEILRPRAQVVVDALSCGDAWHAEWLAELVVSLMDGIAGVAACKLRALRDAFGEVGRESLGLEPDTLFAVQPLWVRAAFDRFRAPIEGATSKQEDVAWPKEVLLAGWAEGFGAGRHPSKDV